jgi:hypothetical protein
MDEIIEIDLLALENASDEVIANNDINVMSEQEYSPESLEEMKAGVDNE